MSTLFRFSKTGIALLSIAAACGAAPPSSQGQEKAPAGAAAEKRLATLKAQGAKAPIAVLPVLVGGKSNPEFGEALGLVLEQQGGFDDVSLARGAFLPPADAAPDAIAALLGEFVRKNPVGGENALLAEFVTEKNRFVAVRTWIVDHEGALVWSDSQKKGDADFDRLPPREPLQCCVLVAERVRALLGVASPAGERDGRMRRHWAAKSGMPTEEERSAMAARAKALQKAGKSAKVVVFPVRVAGELDVAQGGELAKLLGGACAATATDAKPAIEIQPSSNEQRMLWDLARAFQAHLVQHPVDADYALLADYLMSPDRKQVGAVHFVVCTGKGEWVVADFQNDHHDDFRTIAPKDADDCDRLVLTRLEQDLR